MFEPWMMRGVGPKEYVEMMVGAGIELGLRFYDGRTGRTSRMCDDVRINDDEFDWACDVDPIWPMYPADHPNRHLVEKAKAAWEFDHGFRAWLDGALWTRAVGGEV